jgi:hypothetical protein
VSACRNDEGGRIDRSRRRGDQVLKVLIAVAAQLRKALADVVGCDERLRWKTEMVDIVPGR